MKSNDIVKKPTTADAAVQTEVAEREYISLKQLSLMQTESKAFPQILYHQHSTLQLVLLLGLLFVYAFYYVEPLGPTSLMDNAKTGVIFVMIAMVVYFVIYLPNTIIQRPHPGLWRMLQALGTCWLCAVVFALFFNREDLLTFLNSFIDPSLGVPIKEHDFSEDCNIYTPNNPKGSFANFTEKLDVFFVAHFVGWLVKMLICRNVKMCMFQSVLFEFIEITFRHWLPNFYECWWDSIILDIVLCNTGGIIAGWWLMKVFKMKEYKWSLRKENTKTSYLQNLKQLFLSPDLEEHEWKVFSSSFRFASVVFFMVLMNMIDLSFFFNKYVLWIRPTHPILSFRTFMIGFLCIPAVREYFEYISNPLQKRLGGTCWLTMAIVFVEFFIFFKNQNGQFTEPFPTYVIIIWVLIFAITLAIFLCLLVKDIKKKFFKQPELAKLHTN